MLLNLKYHMVSSGDCLDCSEIDPQDWQTTCQLDYRHNSVHVGPQGGVQLLVQSLAAGYWLEACTKVDVICFQLCLIPEDLALFSGHNPCSF